jgi:hypothetical protein
LLFFTPFSRYSALFPNWPSFYPFTSRMSIIQFGLHPRFFVVAEDLGKFLSRLHKATCRIDWVVGLRQLNNPLLPLKTSAPTQKVLADEASPARPIRSSLTPMGATSRPQDRVISREEASPRNLPGSSQSHPHPLTSETTCPRPGLSASSRHIQGFPPRGWQKNWGRASSI